MAQTIDQLSSEFHAILKADPGPNGRQQVCRRLETALKDDSFVATYLPDGTPSRKLLYEDAELGFCVLAHAYDDARESSPHDHGPYWAIYGQAVGETEMTEWDVVEPATPDKPGKVRKAKTYALTPGVAQVYNEGQLHSPRRAGPTRLIRIEGKNLDDVKRLRYEPV